MVTPRSAACSAVKSHVESHMMLHFTVNSVPLGHELEGA